MKSSCSPGLILSSICWYLLWLSAHNQIGWKKLATKPGYVCGQDYSSDVVKYFGQILFFHRAPFTFSMKDDVCVSSSHIRGIVYQSDKSKTSSHIWKSVLHISLISVTRFAGSVMFCLFRGAYAPRYWYAARISGLLSFVRFAHLAKFRFVRHHQYG